jgi:hypothetical protein
MKPHLIAIALSVPLLAGLAELAAASPPGATELNGQKVLTLVVREPPALRCNNNMQIAAELANLYKVPVLVVPASLAPASKAPAVYWGEQLIAEDGGDFNGMVGFSQMQDIVDIEGVPKQDKQGRLLEVKKEFESLKSAIKGGQ